MPLLHVDDGLPELVDVESSAESPVGRHDDIADVLDLPLGKERMMVLDVAVSYMVNDTAHGVSIGTGLLHALLRLPHLGGRNHLHGRGYLLSALHTADFRTYFLSA